MRPSISKRSDGPLDWATYKARCDHPRVLSRWMLNRTAQWVAPPLAEALRAATQGPALPKPDDHKGGPDTDMFEVDLDGALVAAIVRGVERAAAGYVSADRSAARRRDPDPPPTGSLNAYVTAWREYRAVGD